MKKDICEPENKINMEIKLMLAVVFLCIAMISATAVSNISSEVNLQSVWNHIDNIDSQISNLQDFDKYIGSKLAMNKNGINILSDALKHFQETSNKCIEKTDSLTQKYEILLKKYEALAAKISNPKQCQSGWFPYKNSCYILMKEEVDWFQAGKWCRNNQAHLVEYRDMDELNFVLSKAKSYRNWDTDRWAGFWVGADDLQSEGVFQWSSSHTQVHFNYWLPTQPDRLAWEEDCMQTLVNKKGEWNDLPCEMKLPFVCEKYM